MFKIWHKKRSSKDVAASAHNSSAVIAFVYKKLPDAGAEQYAYETYGTPIYDFALGNGATFVRRPLRETFPALWANFTSPVVANPPLNTFQGQFATQPLLDPNTAVALGLTVEVAISPGAYNVLSPQGPTIAP